MQDTKPIEYGEELLSQVQLLWGEGFLSPGGREEVAKIVEGVELNEKEVLDVGVGLGGPACLLVLEHGASRVVGIDVQDAALRNAASNVRKRGLGDRVILQRVEPGPWPFNDESFDAIFSKDSILHVREKATLFREMHRVLRSGGWTLVSDWHSGDESFSQEMVELFEGLGQELTFVSIEKQASFLAEAGFADTATVDRNSWYQEMASRDLERLCGPDRPRLEAELGRTGAEELIKMTKLFAAGVEQGMLQLGHVRGRKRG
jgi:phosphoethanolamine N-methyltransferase